MAVLTVRNIDDDLKRDLRVAAAQRGVSMEEHVRQVLRDSTQPPAESGLGLLDSIRRRFVGLGDVVLDIPSRCDPPRTADFDP